MRLSISLIIPIMTYWDQRSLQCTDLDFYQINLYLHWFYWTVCAQILRIARKWTFAFWKINCIENKYGVPENIMFHWNIKGIVGVYNAAHTHFGLAQYYRYYMLVPILFVDSNQMEVFNKAVCMFIACFASARAFNFLARCGKNTQYFAH